MSDILIKDMEMPTSCEKCIYSGWSNFYQIYVCNAVRKDEPVLFDRKQVKSTAIVRGGRADNCPLVPVPPHGDLIDRDDLPWEKQGLMLTSPDEWGIEARYIEAAPTIIPADKEEKKHENLGR